MVRKNGPSADQPGGPPRAIIYTRLSRAKTGTSRIDAERNTEASLETQQASCERAIAALHGVVVGIESDVAAGDRIDNRRGLFRALDRIEAGEADTLVVHSIERLSRDGDQRGYVGYLLRRAGGRLVSATEEITDDPIGKAMQGLLTLSGEIELARIRERTRRAFDAKFKQSQKYKPSNRPPYGYRKIGNGASATYDLHPAEALIVKRIYSERAAGTSLRLIAAGLNDEGIPTPTGRGQWGSTTLVRILERPVYGTGLHDCWVTQTVRNGEGKPQQVERPAEDRYVVEFPTIVSPELAARAYDTSARNLTASARHDRPGEYGIGRYGIFKCGSCGRNLTVVHRGKWKGRPRYLCDGHKHGIPCPKPTSMSVELLDWPVWWWVQAVLENPAGAESWQVVKQAPVVDDNVIQALREAEQQVAELESVADTLLGNLERMPLAGRAAERAAARLEQLEADITAATLNRDRLAALAAPADAPPVNVMVAQDALARATLHALEAMQAADPDAQQKHGINVKGAGRQYNATVPDSWKAKRAAMNMLGFTLHLFPEDSEHPRWIAEMRLPDGTVIAGHHLPAPHQFTMPGEPMTNLYRASA